MLISQVISLVDQQAVRLTLSIFEFRLLTPSSERAEMHTVWIAGQCENCTPDEVQISSELFELLKSHTSDEGVQRTRIDVEWIPAGTERRNANLVSQNAFTPEMPLAES